MMPNTVCPPPLFFQQPSHSEDKKKRGLLSTQLEFTASSNYPIPTTGDSVATAEHWLALQPSSPELEDSPTSEDEEDGSGQEGACVKDRIQILTALAEDILGLESSFESKEPKSTTVLMENAASQTETALGLKRRKKKSSRSKSVDTTSAKCRRRKKLLKQNHGGANKVTLRNLKSALKSKSVPSVMKPMFPQRPHSSKINKVNQTPVKMAKVSYSGQSQHPNKLVVRMPKVADGDQEGWEPTQTRSLSKVATDTKSGARKVEVDSRDDRRSRDVLTLLNQLGCDDADSVTALPPSPFDNLHFKDRHMSPFEVDSVASSHNVAHGKDSSSATIASAYFKNSHDTAVSVLASGYPYREMVSVGVMTECEAGEKTANQVADQSVDVSVPTDDKHCQQNSEARPVTPTGPEDTSIPLCLQTMSPTGKHSGTEIDTSTQESSQSVLIPEAKPDEQGTPSISPGRRVPQELQKHKDVTDDATMLEATEHGCSQGESASATNVSEPEEVTPEAQQDSETVTSTTIHEVEDDSSDHSSSSDVRREELVFSAGKSGSESSVDSLSVPEDIDSYSDDFESDSLTFDGISSS